MQQELQDRMLHGAGADADANQRSDFRGPNGVAYDKPSNDESADGNTKQRPLVISNTKSD